MVKSWYGIWLRPWTRKKWTTTIFVWLQWRYVNPLNTIAFAECETNGLIEQIPLFFTAFFGESF